MYGKKKKLSSRQIIKLNRMQEIVKFLEDNSRIKLIELSRKLNIPVTEVFDIMKEIEKKYKFTIVEKLIGDEKNE